MLRRLALVEPCKAQYLQVADALREQIALGEYVEGQVLPSEAVLLELHAVSLMTIRRALAILREEGLIATQRGRPARVRRRPERRWFALEAGSRLISRMPTSDERVGLGIERGVPVLEIRRADGTIETLDAESVEVVVQPQLRAQVVRGVASGRAHPAAAL
ncbi:GntR family transcriptional regulator [Dactylosporangium sp. NPDC000555]|uniref:GntR family transcriptional regulator n=1 Tax=Dactylosporangium sp. NPDC000555 TaxID=3154260 RepID=UPI00331AE7F7